MLGLKKLFNKTILLSGNTIEWNIGNRNNIPDSMLGV